MIPIEVLIDYCSCSNHDNCNKCKANSYCHSSVSSFGIEPELVKILQRNIPKQPKRMGEKLDKCWICPSCKTKLDTWCWSHKHTYCEECGQKLKWGE